jgi:hypothetical protein
LVFICTTVSGHSLLNLQRRILTHRQTGFRQGQHGYTSRLSHADSRGHIALKKQLLHRATIWSMEKQNLLQTMVQL